MKYSSLIVVVTLLSTSAWSQDSELGGRPPDISPAAPEVEAGAVPEAEVTITEQDGKTIEKYSVNGQVYMIKVISGDAPPYYLLDLDGDGVMDVTRDSPEDISVPQWVLFQW